MQDQYDEGELEDYDYEYEGEWILNENFDWYRQEAEKEAESAGSNAEHSGQTP